MQRTIYDILEEPRGEVYEGLIDYCTGLGLDFLLVVRGDGAGDVVQRVLRRLAADREERGPLSQWPGTVLHGHTAMVSRHRSSPSAAAVLKGSAQGLYDWIEPDLPEDLCFLRPHGGTYLATIAHEADSYLELDATEYDSLMATVPGMVLGLHCSAGTSIPQPQ